ncbi:hypothetical protein LK542_19075 [Massilia sp. IC2-477]|uniref:hypothetical protein n=1 Tax=Massilia sp. IC2-477 TaxID=2887198 RepID=UPI001D10E803|nr:hypothetical protein [Massilia sp. IC2-477]MCC2957725.1 hypothetical protein [Massilia sp. IC2-477]
MSVLLALCAAVLLLDAWAAWKLFRSPFYDAGQRGIQLALVLLLPVAGAWVVLYMARKDLPPVRSHPVDHVQDLGFGSNDLREDDRASDDLSPDD